MWKGEKYQVNKQDMFICREPIALIFFLEFMKPSTVGLSEMVGGGYVVISRVEQEGNIVSF